MKMRFVVADDELACEALLIGRPVLEKLSVDTPKILENNRFAINGADRSTVENTTAKYSGRYVSRILIVRLNGEPSTQTSFPTYDRPGVNYQAGRHDEDPFRTPPFGIQLKATNMKTFPMQ